MAIELCYAETTPRISFSHDFCSSSAILPMQQCCPLRSTSSLPLNPSIDFEFDVRINDINQECYSSADELFSNGKILPLQIKKKISPSEKDQTQPPPPPQKPQPQARNDSSNDQNQSSKSSSFWQFKRSSSLGFVSGYKRRLFPLSTLLSRSSSTGSAPKAKAGNHRQNYQKEKSLPWLQPSSSNQKPPLKKSFSYGSHGHGVTINPVLNVPLVDVFCLSSVFLTGKDKKK